jgi:hypothetical protein
MGLTLQPRMGALQVDAVRARASAKRVTPACLSNSKPCPGRSWAGESTPPEAKQATGCFRTAVVRSRVWSDIGVSDRQRVRDLWRQQDLGKFAGFLP